MLPVKLKELARPTHARVTSFGWHQGPTVPTKVLRVYPENFVTEPHTTHRLLYIAIKILEEKMHIDRGNNFAPLIAENLYCATFKTSIKSLR